MTFGTNPNPVGDHISPVIAAINAVTPSTVVAPTNANPIPRFHIRSVPVLAQPTSSVTNANTLITPSTTVQSPIDAALLVSLGTQTLDSHSEMLIC